jgi:hypothetical protein
VRKYDHLEKTKGCFLEISWSNKVVILHKKQPPKVTALFWGNMKRKWFVRLQTNQNKNVRKSYKESVPNSAQYRKVFLIEFFQ